MAADLVDLDDLCVSNVNRQLHALDGQIGHPKAAVMADRVAAIHPECRVTVEATFYTDATSVHLGDPGVRRQSWCPRRHRQWQAQVPTLLNACRERGIPVVTVGGAGGRKAIRAR